MQLTKPSSISSSSSDEICIETEQKTICMLKKYCNPQKIYISCMIYMKYVYIHLIVNKIIVSKISLFQLSLPMNLQNNYS